MSDKKHEGTELYEVIRQHVDLLEFCERQGGMSFRKIGNSYRANSPFSGARGSFCINVDAPAFWLDFVETDNDNATRYRQGDVIELCTLLNHDGDKRAALVELLEFLPEEQRKKYSEALTKYMRERESEQEKIQRSHETLVSGQFTSFQHWIPYLHSRGIDDEQIQRCRIGVDVNDFKLLIPRFNFDGVEVLGHNRRRMPNSKGKEREEEPKYMYSQCNSFVRKVPLGLQTLSRKSKYLVLTEGDFDALNFEREGFAVLGVFSGEYWPIVLSNAENFECVVLAYDNDEQGKKYTQNAAQILLQHRIPFCVVELPSGFKDVNDFYRSHIATHDTCLQELIDGAIDGLEFMAKSFIPEKGLDSLKRSEQKELQERLKNFLIHIVRSGLDKADMISLYNRLAHYYPANWLDAILTLAKEGETEYQTVEALRKKHELLFNERTGFYRYDSAKGVWLSLDDKFIGSLIREYLGYSASAKKIHNITEHLKSTVSGLEPITKFNKLPVFAFANGTWYQNAKAKEEELFRPASSTDYVTHRVSYSYDATAECPTWIQAVSTVFAGDQRRIDCLQEFCGYCLLNHCRYQKALILRDKSKNGSNGKSTLLDVLREVFGSENCTSLAPVTFEDKYSLIQLKDARVNICSEANSGSEHAESNLKAAITGETLRGRFLHRDFIEFKNTAKIIFAINGSVHFKDISGSMKRRLLVIDCPVRFVDDPQEGNEFEVKADNNIKAKLLQELSGIFNWCLSGARRLIRNGGKFTKTEEQSELDTLFSARNDYGIEDFVTEFCTETVDLDGNGRTFTRSEVYAGYIVYCEAEGIEETVSRKSFHELFRQALKAKGIQFREYKNSKGIWYYDFS